MLNRIAVLALSALLPISVVASELGDAVQEDYDAYLWPLFDDENRALHDFIVDTRVVRA